MKSFNRISKFSNLGPIARLLVVVFALTVAASAAKADTIITYDVTGTFASGGTLSGDFTADMTTDTVTSVNLTADGVNFTNCPGGPSGTCTIYNNLGGNDGFGVANSSGWPYVTIVWSPVDLTNPPNDLTLVSATTCVDCGANGVFWYGAYWDTLVSGTAVDPPTVPTPEGGTTLAMLLAGLLSLGLFAGWQSRRGKLAGQLA
jgi:hypothetical protein